MKTIRLIIDLTYDEKLEGSTPKDEMIFREELRCDNELVLYSNCLDEEIGEVKVVKIL